MNNGSTNMSQAFYLVLACTMRNKIGFLHIGHGWQKRITKCLGIPNGKNPLRLNYSGAWNINGKSRDSFFNNTSSNSFQHPHPLLFLWGTKPKKAKVNMAKICKAGIWLIWIVDGTVKVLRILVLEVKNLKTLKMESNKNGEI